MTHAVRGKAVVKFVFWTAVVIALFGYVIHTYKTGLMSSWYYHTAAEDGYAINATTFVDATPDAAALLRIGSFARIEGLQAVRVRAGERLPANTNGLITDKELAKGRRVALEGDVIKVTVPWEIKETKGFKFKDTFKHKGVKTNPWAGVWNVAIVLGLGFTLGLMAEGFTDMLGLKLTRIHHH